jgi:hypothetical protein
LKDFWMAADFSWSLEVLLKIKKIPVFGIYCVRFFYCSGWIRSPPWLVGSLASSVKRINTLLVFVAAFDQRKPLGQGELLQRGDREARGTAGHQVSFSLLFNLLFLKKTFIFGTVPHCSLFIPNIIHSFIRIRNPEWLNNQDPDPG